MAYTMPSFVSRLFRPFTSSGASFGITTVESGGRLKKVVNAPEGAEKATLAAGCFWGVEHLYRKHFDIYDTEVGFTGGHTKNPTYREVCTGKTGHAEAVAVYYDPTRVTYAQIIEFFYNTHDPTTKNQQGVDVGSQYRSAIFFHNEEQEKVAREITRKANEQWYKGGIVTEIVPAPHFWPAELMHQEYLNSNPGGYQCENHQVHDLPPLQ